ncbi:MAG TPA: cyclic nucleotide-binding protein [Desulfosporosinus sp.]|nr:cyclic nucleotide-binding protein [Desulfosporosinus sp.]
MDLLKHPDVTISEFKKGDYIIRQGEKVEFLYLLVSGTCHRSIITEKGDEIIFAIRKPSENFIQSLLGVLILYSNGISVSNFIADTKCRCYRIPKQTFLDYVQDKTNLLNQIIGLAVHESRELASSFQARQEGKVSKRFCELLLNNTQQKQGKLVVSKDYSNLTKISKFLGIHRVTVAKIVKVLKEKGVIIKDENGIVILDEDKLLSFARAEKVIEY